MADKYEFPIQNQVYFDKKLLSEAPIKNDEVDIDQVEVNDVSDVDTDPKVKANSWSDLLRELVNLEKEKDFTSFMQYHLWVKSSFDTNVPPVFTISRMRFMKVSPSALKLYNQNRTAAFSIFRKYFLRWNKDETGSVFIQMKNKLTYVLVFE